MEILQVAENSKFLNTLGKFHMRNTYKTKKPVHYTKPHYPNYPLSPYRTFLQYVTHES